MRSCRLIAEDDQLRGGMARKSTAGYSEQADDLAAQYESVRFADVHGPALHLLPTVPSRILDIGAGTGRDAAALAAMGHRVVAVEPVAAFRTKAQTVHSSPLVEWVDDSLPDLERLAGQNEPFDVALLTAVWMHLDEPQRHRAMRRMTDLVRGGGLMLMTLRYGPIPEGRRMFEVSAEETIQLARAEHWHLVLRLEHQADLFGRPEVKWTRLGLRKA
jgi:2-polyprenyl-3-methyl-5-hydroxy-6-metoxy-1,4-benzoquinol methylase